MAASVARRLEMAAGVRVALPPLSVNSFDIQAFPCMVDGGGSILGTIDWKAFPSLPASSRTTRSGTSRRNSTSRSMNFYPTWGHAR